MTSLSTVKEHVKKVSVMAALSRTRGPSWRQVLSKSHVGPASNSVMTVGRNTFSSTGAP